MVEERPEEKAEPESRDEAEQPSTSRPEEQPHASEPTYSLEPQPQGEAEQPPASRPQEEPQTQEPPVPEVQAEFSEGSAAAHLNLGAYITRAWDLTTRDFVNVVVGYLIVAAILGASVITLVGPLILTGPLLFGYLWLIQKRLKGEAATVGSVFDGFKDFQKPFLAGLPRSIYREDLRKTYRLAFFERHVKYLVKRPDTLALSSGNSQKRGVGDPCFSRKGFDA